MRRTIINISAPISQVHDVPFNKSLTIISHSFIQPYSHSYSHYKHIIITLYISVHLCSFHLIEIQSCLIKSIKILLSVGSITEK
jgi:hypothetical protein